MGIIIDTNCLSCVFKENESKHTEFRPVLKWIESGRGKMVYGGTKYKDELLKCPGVLSFITELSRSRKTLSIDTTSVDEYEKEVIQKTLGTTCDDQHIIAIVAISGCRIICSQDKRAKPFFKNSDYYPRHIKIPKIYSGKRHSFLLSRDYKMK